MLVVERRVNAELVGMLEAWYREAHREMPWRPKPGGELGDPYHALVSEAMLQQTQVATVLPYFGRFMTELPTVGDLAAADEQRVLRLWQGLGYYRRARNLHAAAKAVMDEHGGVIPGTVAGLLSLPGVGPYTAGAIASIAFGIKAPIVDGNVGRVFARLSGYDQAIDGKDGKKWVWGEAERLVEECEVPGDFNQAVMELGATVCTPKGPRCLYCPVSGVCETLAERGADRVTELPVMMPKKKAKRVVHRVVAAERDGAWLLEQRGDGGLWAGMWQVPTLEDESVKKAVLNGWFAERFGLELEKLERIGAFEHATTHRAIRFEVMRGRVLGGRLRRGAGVWRRLKALDDLPLAKPQLRVVGMLGEA
ncbi:MAG: A/G-specific adenine glycosylase [Planctomycetota bacterium]